MDGRPNPEDVDGKLFDGDMILTKKQRRPLEERTLYQYEENTLLYFWPPTPESIDQYPFVPYVFYPSLGLDCVNVIKDCIAHWEANTCITFQETTNFDQLLVVFQLADGFHSFIGRQYLDNFQTIHIGPSCDKLSILRMIGVTLLYGFEDNRPDRDNYIHINTENIINDQQSRFDIEDRLIVPVEYDYTSLFHDSFRFGNKNGLPTISTLDPLDNYLLKAQNRLTFRDMLLGNSMYNCTLSDGLQCAIEIIAPQGLKPSLTFHTFNLQPRTTCTEGDCCYDENLQFRENYPESSTANVTTCGWSADLTFVSDPNCIPTEGGCTLQFNDISTYNWKSPGFDGTTEYPICSICTQDMTGMPNTMLYLTSESFNVGTPPVDGECTDDYIQINHLYGRSEKFCGSEPIYFTSPSSSFSLEFHSNYITPATGFDITMTMASYCASDCHQDIQLMSGETYTIETPDYQRKIFTNLNCEYNFIAPEGKQIEIKKLITKVKANTECTSNFLLVNGDGDRRYPMDTSTIICDYDTRIDHLTTNTNNLLVAYQKTGLDSKGFKMVIMAT
ncbi:hypothetical protein Pmani_011273 [Petrolisthes manimaculis]|uniref:Metalloendopeptidase n=1 Tax=Petrolisthes manimaculis TaxID=1843537 RepID=A0AAE1Q117_9EUCA|nr:hypothetical protein Pmani_011273 [Petrolisthes manimaculis]